VIEFNWKEFSNRKLNGVFSNSSILAVNEIFNRKKFDCLIAIRSLHHTGKLQTALQNALDFFETWWESSYYGLQ